MDLDKVFFEADQLYDNFKFKKSFELFQKAANAGHVASMSRLALMYCQGEGIEQNYDKSIEWDDKAYENGYTASLLNKAITFRQMGRILDYKFWLQEALKEGDGEAALQLAKLYMISEKERDKVVQYLEIVLSHDNVYEVSVEEVKDLLDEVRKKTGGQK